MDENIKQYIDKSALVAEIERKRDYYKRNPLLINAKYCIDEDNAILDYIDTLEVKETYLKKDFELTWKDVAWIVNKIILKCKVEGILTAEDICKDALKQFKAQKEK